MSIPLTEAQAQAFLTDKRNKAKPVARKILSYLNASAAFMLANGDVIYHEQGYHRLDFKDFFALVTKRESAFTTNHNCEYFLANHSLHLADFEQYFPGAYDFSVASLRKIDSAYNRLVKSGVSEADIFLPLVCYVAEVFIRQTNGHWSKNSSTTDAVAIMGQDEKLYDPYFCIRKILINTHKPYAIESVITGQLAAPFAEAG